MPDIYRRKVNGKTVWYAKLWVGGRLLPRSTGTSSKRLAAQRAKQMQHDHRARIPRYPARAPTRA